MHVCNLQLWVLYTQAFIFNHFKANTPVATFFLLLILQNTLLAYLRKPLLRPWALLVDAVDRSCCRPAWWLYCYRRGRAALSTIAPHFRTLNVWQYRILTMHQQHHGNIWNSENGFQKIKGLHSFQHSTYIGPYKPLNYICLNAKFAIIRNSRPSV